MPSQTPNKAIPYALDADARALWPTTSQDVAERIDALLTAKDALTYTGTASTTAQTALANNVWSDVTFDSTGGSPEITYAAGSMTYTGPPRLFLASFGANVGANGSQPSSALRLLLNGSVAAEPHHNSSYGSLSGAIPVMLGAGVAHQTVTLAAWANDGSGALGGAHDRAYLRLATLG